MSIPNSPPNDSLRSLAFTELFQTLSDETRFRLLRLLAREELTVNELSAITNLAQPRISNHLKILKDHRLIVERRDGSWRHYRVDRDQLPESARTLWPSLEAAWSDPAHAADDLRLSEVLSARMSTMRGSFFDQLATRWDDIRESLFGDALGREILQAFLPAGLVVADIGTGTGYTLQLFGARAARLIAIDNSEAMLSEARRKIEALGLRNVEFRLADASHSPLEREEADIITVVQVLHHLDQPGAAILGLAEGLKPGGRLLISDFAEHSESWLRTELQHRWSGFTQNRIAGWFAEAGLELERWQVLPGRVYSPPDGSKVLIPDGFTAVARK